MGTSMNIFILVSWTPSENHEMGCLKIGYFQFQRIVIPFSTKMAINREYQTTIISSWLIGYLIVNPVYPIIIYNYMYPILWLVYPITNLLLLYYGYIMVIIAKS